MVAMKARKERNQTREKVQSWIYWVEGQWEDPGTYQTCRDYSLINEVLSMVFSSQPVTSGSLRLMFFELLIYLWTLSPYCCFIHLISYKFCFCLFLLTRVLCNKWSVRMCSHEMSELLIDLRKIQMITDVWFLRICYKQDWHFSGTWNTSTVP